MRRREFLAAIPAGAATLALGRGDALATTLESTVLAPDAGDLVGRAAPWWLLAPLRAGDEIGLGWRVTGLEPVRHGAAVITIGRGAREARIHLCARRGRARGVASTRHFDLMLMNEGDGFVVTDEALGRVIKTLGEYVSRGERQPRTATLLRGMLPHHVRVDRYAGGSRVLA